MAVFFLAPLAYAASPFGGDAQISSLFKSEELSIFVAHGWQYTAAHTAWGEDFTDGLHLLICQRDVEGFQQVGEVVGMGGADDGEHVRILLQHPCHGEVAGRAALAIGNLLQLLHDGTVVLHILSITVTGF